MKKMWLIRINLLHASVHLAPNVAIMLYHNGCTPGVSLD